MPLRRWSLVSLCLVVPAACFDPTPDDPGGVTADDSTGGTSNGTVSVGDDDDDDDDGNSNTDPSADDAPDDSESVDDDATVGDDDATVTVTLTDPTEDDQGSDTVVDDGSTGPAGCGGDEVCVPPVPEGWNGPIVVGDAACPPEYPTADRVIHEGLVPGVPECNCSCNLGAVQCQLWLENEGIEFDPVGSCDDPPNDDECISAIVQASCNESYVDEPAVASWRSTGTACSGSEEGAACDGGTCRPDVADVCIWQDGEVACPAGFDDQTTFFSDFDDSRDCTDCSCTPSGQSCEIEIEVCSVGFFDVDLQSGGSCWQLNSSDGDSVTLLSSAITDQGSCVENANGGEIVGEVVETGPVTVCCMP